MKIVAILVAYIFMIGVVYRANDDGYYREDMDGVAAAFWPITLIIALGWYITDLVWAYLRKRRHE